MLLGHFQTLKKTRKQASTNPGILILIFLGPGHAKAHPQPAFPFSPVCTEHLPTTQTWEPCGSAWEPRAEERKLFECTCKVSPEGSCMENTQGRKIPNAGNCPSPQLPCRHQCCADSTQQLSFLLHQAGRGTGRPIVADAKWAPLVFAQDAVFF